MTKSASIDSTSVRAHQHAAGGSGGDARNAIGRSRGGRTTKIHVAVSDDRTLQTLYVSPGQHADIRYAPRVVAPLHRKRIRKLMADRAYDADSLIDALQASGIKAVIPPRRNRRFMRPWNRRAYRDRNRVERFFAHLKQFRRLATRYDKRLAMFKAGIWIAAVCIFGRNLERGLALT